MSTGTFRARAATTAAFLAVAGCGGSAAATPTPTPVVFGTSIPNPSNSSNPTGRHWAGTEHMVLVFGAGCTVTVDGTLGLVVSKGGQVSGTANGSWVYLHTSCGVGSDSRQQTVSITGTLPRTQFQLTIPFGFPGLQLPVTVALTSPKSAHAHAADLAGAPRTYTIDLTCSDC